MSSTKDCGCLRDADGKIDMTRCPIHPTPSTRDPKSKHKHDHCVLCATQFKHSTDEVCTCGCHTPQATKPVDELTMTVYFTERQLSELKAGEKLELPLTDDLRQAISNQVASAVKKAHVCASQYCNNSTTYCAECNSLWEK